jgi:hypothetical protein
MLQKATFDQQTATSYQKINAGTRKHSIRDEISQELQFFKIKMFVNKDFKHPT